MADKDMINFDKEFLLSKHFPFPTYEQWKAEAEKLLKGAPFDKIMRTETVEGITLEAIYNAEDITDIPFVNTKPGFFPYVRGSSFAKMVVNGWDIQQELDPLPPPEWNELTIQALLKGQNAIRVQIDKETPIAELFKGISLEHIHIDIEAPLDLLHIYQMYEQYCIDRGISISDIKGSVSGDAVKCLAEHGSLKVPMDKKLDEIAAVTKKTIASKTQLNTIMIDVSIYNDSGSSAVDDLGMMASTLAFYADELLKRGLTANEVFARTTVVMAVGNNLFMEISKLRATRYIYAKIAEAYGADKENARMRLHVRTSTYTKTYYDPWVNILRTTTETFSAVIGGCDSLHVTPFDTAIGESDEFSRRIARNQQIILLEESHLNAVNDPAGGSYYVEALTHMLIKHGWEYFLNTEDMGGIMVAFESGKIREKIDKSHEYRLKNAETRKDALVGTSTFPNLNEKKIEKKAQKQLKIPDCPAHALPKRRLSQSWEMLRYKVESMTPRPEVIVVNIGQTVKNKPRVDFCLGYFEPAGLISTTNEGFDNVDEALDFSLKSTAKIVVLCSTDDMYPTIVPDFAQKFRERQSGKVLVLAGYPKEYIEAFTATGVQFFVYMRQNVVSTIHAILEKI
jgi:methylmalonyl-CoA mutase